MYIRVLIPRVSIYYETRAILHLGRILFDYFRVLGVRQNSHLKQVQLSTE